MKNENFLESEGKEFNLYKDIESRTGGEIYIGVVGPVRTGKSTFIKRFMDLMVLPGIEDENSKEQANDELPQSGNGKIIMTTEPKFIPKEGALVKINDDIKVKIRFIDCVGYIAEGAEGIQDEDGNERMVKTPWFDYEVPFTKAAEIGTNKVINNHSSIGIVITSDGSFGGLSEDAYVKAQERAILELKKIGKPFVVLVNTNDVFSKKVLHMAEDIENKYKVSAMPINCQQLRKEDIHSIMKSILYEFPVKKIEFFMPKWIEMLQDNHIIKENIIQNIKNILDKVNIIRDLIDFTPEFSGDYITKTIMSDIDMGNGCVKVNLLADEKYYYENMSELTGTVIENEYQLISIIKELSIMRMEYEKVSKALEMVRSKGYGVVMPELKEIVLEEPTVIKHGNKYGVKIKADSPSIHLIKAGIETEIAPIVGSEPQAKDLIDYIKSNQNSEDGVWKTNIFGKSIEELVEDGIKTKIAMMTDECQIKLQDTMQKIVNDNSGGMVCIIL